MLYLMATVLGIALLILSYYDFHLKLTVTSHLIVFMLIGIGLGSIYQLKTGDIYWFSYCAFASITVLILAFVLVKLKKLGELDVYPLALVGIYLPVAPKVSSAFHINSVYSSPLFPITVFGNALLLMYVYFTVLRVRWLVTVRHKWKRVYKGLQHLGVKVGFLVLFLGMDSVVAHGISPWGVRAIILLIAWGLFNKGFTSKSDWRDSVITALAGIFLIHYFGFPPKYHALLILLLWLNSGLVKATEDNKWLTTIRSVEELRPFMRLTDVVVRVDDMYVKMNYKNVSKISVLLRKKDTGASKIEFIAGYPSQLLTFDQIRRLEKLVKAKKLKDGFRVSLPIPFIPFVLLGFVMSLVVGDVISVLVYLASLP